MAYLTVEINCSKTINALNNACADAKTRQNAINGIVDVLMAMAAGTDQGSVKVVVKDAASTINTSGSGSTSNTYTI